MTDNMAIDPLHSDKDVRIARLFIGALPRGAGIARNAFGLIAAESAAHDAIARMASTMHPERREAGACDDLYDNCVFFFGGGRGDGICADSLVGMLPATKRAAKYALVDATSLVLKGAQNISCDPSPAAVLLNDLAKRGGKAVPVEVATFHFAELAEFLHAKTAGRIVHCELAQFMEQLSFPWSSSAGTQGPIRCNLALEDLLLQ